MKWLALFTKWIAERFSPASLRDHVAFVKSQNEALATKVADLAAQVKKTETERDNCKAQSEALQAQLDDTRKRIEKLNSGAVAPNERANLERRLAQLQSRNKELENLLRIKSIGF